MDLVAWSGVPTLWQKAFELAWQTFQEGSNPIGALIADASGTVVATGKSAVRAPVSGVKLAHCEIAHAEVNALMQLDNRLHSKRRSAQYTLYSTLEPCPLCMSALYMSDVKSLSFAATDSFAGSVNLLGTTPYLQRKQRRVDGPVPGLGEVSIFLNVYYNVLHRESANAIHDAFAEDYPEAVAAALSLAEQDVLKLRENQPVDTAFDKVVEVLRKPDA